MTRKRGRPPKAPEDRRRSMPRISIALTPDERLELRRQAQEAGLSMAAYVRSRLGL